MDKTCGTLEKPCREAAADIVMQELSSLAEKADIAEEKLLLKLSRYINSGPEEIARNEKIRTEMPDYFSEITGYSNRISQTLSAIQTLTERAEL